MEREGWSAEARGCYNGCVGDEQEGNLSDLAKEGVSQQSLHLQVISLIHHASVVSHC